MKTGLASAILLNYLLAASGLAALFARLLGWNFSMTNAVSRLVVGLGTGLFIAHEPNDNKALSLLGISAGPLAWSLGCRRGSLVLVPWLTSLGSLVYRACQWVDEDTSPTNMF